jgi:hypothetical protein
VTEVSDSAGVGDVQRNDAEEGVDHSFTHPGPDAPWLTPAGGPAVPWQVVYGPGTASEDVALIVAEQCAARGVGAVLRTLDEYPTTGLKGFQGLLLVLPSAPPAQGKEPKWKAFRRIAEDFRARTIKAAEAFVPGSDCWQKAGVLQVFYTDDALDDPDALALIHDACAVHSFTPDTPFTADLFEVYQPGSAQSKTKDQVAVARASNWRQLTAWGIDTVEFARVIKRAIDKRRDELDDPNKRAMYRPIPDIDMNRLDLVLFRPDATPPADPGSTVDERKKALDTFRDNGARAVRVLVDEMEKAHPPFARPPAKAGRRDAQPAFTKLYQLLRVVTSSS